MAYCKILRQLFPSWKQKSPLIPTKIGWWNQLNLLVILQVYGNVFNIFTKKREVPECLQVDFLFYKKRTFFLQKKTLLWKEIRTQKLDKKYPKVVSKFWKVLNILKPNNIILCRFGSRITVNLKLNVRFPINHFSIIVQPPPCTARCVLSCADISYFISDSVTVDRRLNAASRKKIILRNFDTFSHQMFLKKRPPPPWLIILMKRIRLLSYYLLLSLSI